MNYLEVKKKYKLITETLENIEKYKWKRNTLVYLAFWDNPS